MGASLFWNPLTIQKNAVWPRNEKFLLRLFFFAHEKQFGRFFFVHEKSATTKVRWAESYSMIDLCQLLFYQDFEMSILVSSCQEKRSYKGRADVC